MSHRLRRTTFWLLWLAVFTVPWQNTLLLPSIGTATRIVGVLAALVAGLSLLRDGRRHRLLDVHVVTWALAGWALLSVFWSVDASTSLTYAATTLQLAVLLSLLWEFADEPGDVSRLGWALVLGCVLGSTSLLLAVGPVDTSSRYTANGFNGNDLASILALGVPLAWYLALNAGRRTQQWLALGYLPLGVAGVLLTATRGALFVLAAGLVLLPLTWRRSSVLVRTATALSAAAAGAVVVLLVPARTLARLATLPAELAEGDLTGRTRLWWAASTLVDQNVLVGTGGGTSLTGMGDLLALPERPHNTFLSLGVDLGGVGLALFCLVLLLSGLHVASAAPVQRASGGCLLAGLLLALLPVHWEQQKALWIGLALVLAVCVRDGRRPPSTTESDGTVRQEAVTA